MNECTIDSIMVYKMASRWKSLCCVLIVLGQVTAVSATAKNTGNPHTTAANYFIKYGYLKDFSDSEDEALLSSTLKRFQRFAGLKVTGELNEETKNQFEIPRCGLSDPIIANRKRRYLLQGNKWDLDAIKNRTLTWRLENTGSGLSRNSIRAEIEKAFDLWQKYGNIRFSEVAAEKADILVKFAGGCHKDPYCFDGKGGTLAHAFYPYPGQAISGDVHFDDGETYVIGKSTGTDLLWVATHEIGHSLGLDHSNTKGAIMFPWYQGYKKDFDLTNDDIGGIVQLYGAARLPQTPTPPLPTTVVKTTTQTVTTQIPSTKATTKLTVTTEESKSATSAQNPNNLPKTTTTTTQLKTVVTTLLRTEKPTERRTEKPTEKSTSWPTAKVTDRPTERSSEIATQRPTDQPEFETKAQTTRKPIERTTRKPYDKNLRFRCTKLIDAAFVSRRFKWMLVFRNDRFYLANKNGIRHGPLIAKRYYRHIDGVIDAALENTVNGETILFSGQKFWIYNGFSRRVGPVPLKLLGLDKTVLRIDAALKWTRNGRYYLFSGIRYWQFNPSKLGVDNQRYPKYIKDHWFGIPEYLSEAVTDFEGITRFIKDDLIYTLIDRAVKADEKSPGKVGEEWMKCRVKKKVPKTKIQEYNGPMVAEP